MLRVISLTYNGGVPFEPEAQVFAHSTPFVAEQNGQIIGCFGIMPFTSSRLRGELKNAGVLGVAVLPSARGTGVGSSMMRWALRHYREQGFELASLYAFRESYYRSFGYECCGLRVKLNIETARLPKFDTSLPAQALTAESVDVVKDCYRAFAWRHSGTCLRSQTQWERVLNPKTHRTLYVVGDPIEAYAIVQHQPDFWSDQWVEEVVWSSLRGYDGILSVLRGIAINKAKIGWHEPSDGPYLSRYFDHGCSAEIERLAMYRVLDVPGALRALKPDFSGEFTVEIADEDIVENRGTWLVQFDTSAVTVERTHQSAGLKMDIRAFAQAVMGEPSLQDLINQGIASVDDDLQALAAGRLLTPCSCYLADFF